MKQKFSLSTLKLRFEDDVEKQFLEDYYEKSLPIIRISFILAIVLYCIFGVLDIIIVPESKYIVWFIRFAIVVPLLVGVYVLSYTRFFKNNMQVILAATGLVVGYGINAMIGIANPGELGYDFYFSGLFLVILWIYALSRMRILYAVASSILVWLGYALVEIIVNGRLSGGMTGNDLPVFINNNFFFISSNLVGIFACYTIEFYLRKDFIQRLTIQEENEKTRGILSTVDETAGELLTGSEELTASTDEIADIVSEHSDLLSEVVNLSGNISSSIDDIRDKSNSQYTIVEDNFAKIKEISVLMEGIYNDSTQQSSNAEKALESAAVNEKHINETVMSINDMRKNSQKIEEISKTISEIADQTNLLSLNAAIESARAGEQGKGFAVVADEISKLATMSIDSSKEIAGIIRNTVNNIETVSSMTESLAEYFNDTISFVRENSQFMKGLNENTYKEFEESKILYSSTVEVDRAARDVIEYTEKLTAFVQRIVDWMKRMQDSGNQIPPNLEDIQNLSKRLEERSRNMNDLLQGQWEQG
ncbi:MAG: methyl-accepting chemotaxis protein [Spirochaetota bacterium]